MKKILIVALVIFAKSAFAQKDTVGLNLPFVNNTIVYERIFDAPNIPKNVLYSNAGLWFAETRPYVADAQLQLTDPTLSRVVGRVTSSLGISKKVFLATNYSNVTYNFTLQVDCKDNKYRIRIYNVVEVDGSMRTPLDDMMLALVNSKPYTFSNAEGTVFKVPDLKSRFQVLNTIAGDVIADINKSIMVDNSF